MKYTINYRLREIIPDEGNGVHIGFDIQFIEPEELPVNDFSFPLSELIEWMEINQPTFFQYYNEVRNSLDKWGPAEAETLDAMGEEALEQLIKIAGDYLNDYNLIVMMFQEFKRRMALPGQMNEEKRKKQDETLNELVDLKKLVDEDQRRYFLFCELAENRIRQSAMEIYPEIAGLSSDKLRLLKNLFAREIDSMHDLLMKLIESE